jgi:hypothetical protein
MDGIEEKKADMKTEVMGGTGMQNSEGPDTDLGTSDEDILEEARTRCDEAEKECEDIYNDIRKSLSFVANIDGAQWETRLKNSRELGEGGARPCLTFNKIGAYVNRVCNDQRQNRPGLRLLPKNDGTDKKDVDIAE